MLNKDTFLQGITILQKIFLNWTFNSKDPMQMQLWYKVFEGLENREFLSLIETYCKTRIHAPGSPNELLSLLTEAEEKKWPDPSQAFSKVRELIREYGWQYGSRDIYNAIRGNAALVKTVRDMESELRELTADDTYTPERFRKAYTLNLKAMCIRIRDEKLKTGTSKKLEAPNITTVGGFLPYEE